MTTQAVERRTQAERRDEAERRLIEAAIRLVARRGLERITLADVGVAAGYSSGLPAHYFGSKSALIVTLAKQVISRFVSALDRVERHRRGLERLLGIVGFYLDSAVADSDTARALLVLLGEGLTNDLIRDEIADLNRRSVGSFEVNLRAGVDAGEIRPDIDPQAQAVLVLAALRGAISQWVLAPDSLNMSRIRDELIANLRRSLAP